MAVSHKLKNTIGAKYISFLLMIGIMLYSYTYFKASSPSSSINEISSQINTASSPNQLMASTCEPANQDVIRTFDMDWSAIGWANPDGNTNYPYIQTFDNVAGSGITMTVTLYQEPNTNSGYNMANPGCANNRCLFETEVTSYVPSGEVLRMYKKNNALIDSVSISFSEPVLLDNFMTGGQRPSGNSDLGVSQLIFWEGPNSSGNRVGAKENCALTNNSSVTNVVVENPISPTDPINILTSTTSNGVTMGNQSSAYYNGSFYAFGKESSRRPWTVLNLDSVAVQSISWMVYGSASEDPATTQDNLRASGNISSYISSFRFSTVTDRLCDANNNSTYPIDFETDDSGNTLVAGSIDFAATQPYANVFGNGQGVTFSTDNPNTLPLNLYDSEGYTNQDDDLERDGHGTGLWAAGNLTNEVLYNLLIINRNTDLATPNDNATGGDVTMHSDLFLQSFSFSFVDLDQNRVSTSTIIFTNTTTGESTTIGFSDLEDGSGSIHETPNVQFGDRHANRIWDIRAEELGMIEFNQVSFATTGSGGIGGICIETSDCQAIISNVTSDNCTNAAPNRYTARWNVAVEGRNVPDNSTINYQYNSNTIQSYPLTGKTGTIPIDDVPADGGSYDTIRVWFPTAADCADTIILKRPVPCPNEVSNTATGEVCNHLSPTDLGGTVWEDWNYNGNMDENSLQGVQGIQVNLYDDCSNIRQTTYTDNNGNYIFSNLNSSTTYRVEFTLPESVACWAKPTRAGTDAGTSIEFASSGNCVNLGIANAADYCQENPDVYVPCFINGDPLSGNTTYSNLEALVTFPYNSNGNTKENIISIATPVEIGATWGMAYQRQSKHIFTSAVLKRHFGFGTIDGTSPTTGGIYAINVTNNNAPILNKWIDINTIGINTGANPRDGSIANSLGATPTTPSYDYAAYDLAGKIGIGDIDMQGDSILWLINLADRSLYGIKNVNPTTPPSVTDVIGPITLPFVGCNSNESDLRPWGLEVYKGKVYIGAICSGETSQDDTALHAYIFEYAPLTNSISTFFDFDMNYERGRAGVGNPPEDIGDWKAWQLAENFPVNRRDNMQPILSDIEFDQDGSMILGIMDRWGIQTQDDMYDPDSTTTSTNIYPTYTALGDVLRICYVNGAYVFEGKSGCAYPNVNTNHTDNNGNDGNEYYQGDYGEDNKYLHETAFGALLYLQGKEEVMITQFDPFLALNEGGIRTLNNTTGDLTQRFLIYDDASTGSGAKGLGLGDLTAKCNPAPLEIGNYIWEDTDGDGIQDACEAPLEGIFVALYKRENGSLGFVDSVRTDVNGQYYFRELDGTQDSLKTGVEYTITVGQLAQYNTSTQRLEFGGRGLTLTYANQGNNIEIDSDGVPYTTDPFANFVNYPSATFIMGEPGCMDHSIDFGFRPTCEMIVTLNQSNCNDNNTPGIETDDYITFTLDVSNTYAGNSNQFQIVYNGAVINEGTYGTTKNLNYADAGQTTRFAADGSTYTFTIRDKDDNICLEEVSSTPVTECSDCPIQICLPVLISKNLVNAGQ